MKRSARVEVRYSVRFLAVMAVMLLLVGCDPAASPVEKQQNSGGLARIEEVQARVRSPHLPAYDITMERDCNETGVVSRCYSVSTDTTSRKDLEFVTASLWLDSPGYLAVLVTFYPNKPTAGTSAASFVFENEQVARVVLAQILAQGTSVEDEVREAMANGGMYIISGADELRGLSGEAGV